MPDTPTPKPLTPDPNPPIFDDAHLNRRTGGDEDLRVELLELFAAEAERLLIQAETAADAATLGGRLRAIAVLARTVGALRLRHVATGLETDCQAGSADLAPLRHAIVEAIDYLHITPG